METRGDNNLDRLVIEGWWSGTMNAVRYIMASWWHHRRGHVGVMLGAMIGAAVLIGALWVGDAVRGSLRRMSEARLGQTQSVLVSGERFFRAALVNELTELQGYKSAAVLMLPGTALMQETGLRARDVQVVGVDDSFWKMGPGLVKGHAQTSPALPGAPGAGQAYVNVALAGQLGLKVGDRVLVRVDDPGPMAREAPLATPGEAGLALPVTVAGVLNRTEFGQFGLAANQTGAVSVFVQREWLAEQLKQSGRANVLLTQAAGSVLRESLGRHWQLVDVQLELRELGERGNSAKPGVIELRSDRVFLEGVIGEAARGVGDEPRGVLTYFVNELRHGERSTPYSMVSGLGVLGEVGGSFEKESSDLAISAWLAEDLQATVGDEIAMSFYVLGEGRKLDEQTVRVRVSEVVAMADARADAGLMPAFPGLATQENCRDWDPGFAIDLEKIRPRDETYWETYRGTPKAWVSLTEAQSWWANRFGNLTAVRWNAERHQRSEIDAALRKKIEPGALGWVVMDVRDMAAAAGSEALDFGALFAGCSMFLVSAAAVLTALLFALSIETRQREIGMLLAVGIARRRVRRWLLTEGVLAALVGTGLGVILAAGYTQAVLWGLEGFWRGAVGLAGDGMVGDSDAAMVVKAEPMWSMSLSSRTMWIGAAINLTVAVLAMGWALRGQRGVNVRAMLSGEGGEAITPSGVLRRKWKVALLPALVLTGLTMVVVVRSGAQSAGALPMMFFLAGAMGLGAMLLWVRAGLWRLAAGWGVEQVSLASAGIKALGRRRGRHLAAVTMLACGLFLVVAVQAQRPVKLNDFQERRSGAGGFALWAQASLPMASDPNDSTTRLALGLEDAMMNGVTLLPWRMREGDETSCLNLHRPVNPRVFGVDATALAERGAFTFTQYWQPAWERDQLVEARSARINADNPWWLLTAAGDVGGDEIPGVVDAGTLQWSLGKRVGEVVEVMDGRGQPLRIRIVGAVQRSILQGGIVIDRRAFVRHFPQETGFRGLLVEVPKGRTVDEVESVRRELSRAYEDVGMEVVTTPARLARFNAVEETYLAIFQMLGALGLMLGSAGMGVVVLRNVGERRGELAVLRAIGFARERVMRLVLAEHWGVVMLGVVCGLLPAVLALQPATRSGTIPMGSLTLVVLGVAASGFLWTTLAVWWAMRGHVKTELNREY